MRNSTRGDLLTSLLCVDQRRYKTTAEPSSRSLTAIDNAMFTLTRDQSHLHCYLLELHITADVYDTV